MDWDSKTTKKHIAEAKAVGLTLLGPGKNAVYRRYQFNDCNHVQEITTQGVRKHGFRCDQCLQSRLKKEAKAVGLTLLGPGKNAVYRRYQFNDCGHEQEIQTGHVRDDGFRCDPCLQTRLKEEAKAVGLTLLGPGKSYQYRLYQFNDCNHEQEIRTGRVRKNGFRCRQCLQAKLKKEAKAVGLTLLGPGKSYQYRLYQFNACGHEQEIATTCVRKDGFRCDLCLQARLKEEAKAAGLTLLGSGKNADYRLYRFNDCNHEQEITTDNLRHNRFHCDQCFHAKFKEEAKAVGLTLLGPGKNAFYRRYQFNDCNHVQEITTHGVRKHGFRCDQCLQSRLKKEAKGVGLTLLGSGKNSSYRLYRLNACDHEQEIQISHVRDDNFRCDPCLQVKLKEEAKAVGLTLLGPGKNKNYRTYQFNACGHEQEIGTGLVRKNGFRCRQCLQAKLKKEAKDAGLTILGPGKNHRYRLYRFNDCNHEQEITMDSIRNGYFLCNQCVETSRSLPSQIYLLEIQVRKKNWLKLGYAKTINTRIKKYGLPKSASIRELVTIDFETGREAHEYESSLHQKYRRRRLPGKRMKEFHTKNGFNECYPMKMLDTLVDELNSIET